MVLGFGGELGIRQYTESIFVGWIAKARRVPTTNKGSNNIIVDRR